MLTTERNSKNEELSPPDWLSQIFHTFFKKVVDRGNKKPYKADMLLQVPREITLNHCQKEHSEVLKEDLKTKPLTVWTCIELARAKNIAAATCLAAVNIPYVLIPLLLKGLVEWIEEHPRREGHSKITGHLIVLCMFLLIFSRVFFMARLKKLYAEIGVIVKNSFGVKNENLKFFQFPPKRYNTYFFNFDKNSIISNKR